jgi:hypothetical protein
LRHKGVVRNEVQERNRMRLLDLVAQSRGDLLIEQGDANGLISLPGPSTLSARLAEARLRYVCDEAVTALSTRIAMQNVETFVDCLRVARVPAPLLWVEWDEEARRRAMVELGCWSSGVQAASWRAGGLVEASSDGRRGQMRCVWQPDRTRSVVDLSPFIVEFDFDDPHFAANRAQAWPSYVALSCVNHPALSAVLSTTAFRLHPQWRDYYTRYCPPGRLQQVLSEAASGVALDVPLLASLSLLMASRGPLRAREIDRARLNHRRLRAGKIPLLSHEEVSVYLDRSSGRVGSNEGGDRQSARAHMVRGHIVRRNETVFWRRAHVRGSADASDVATRTVRLRMHAR